MSNTANEIKAIQTALNNLGHAVGPADGLFGLKTKMGAMSWIGMNGKAKPSTPTSSAYGVSKEYNGLPWIQRAMEVYGRHEVKDNSFLRAWLFKDRKTLGDPAKLPWCGDYVETSIKLGLPAEKFSGALATNPYWARNWALFGKAIAPTFGAIVAFERPGGGGHVAFLVGQDTNYFYVLGGNQSNAVNITRILKSRLLVNGCRWPLTWDAPKIYLPVMTPGQTTISTNEA